MSDIEVFEFDDSFDPLEDMGLTPDDEIEQHDYLSPIPDADRSVIPDPVILSPEEKIAKLIKGIPGQMHRILHIVACCEQPATLAQIEKDTEAIYPQGGSVYSVGRLVQLLVDADALVNLDAAEDVQNDSEPNAAEETAEGRTAMAESTADDAAESASGLAPAKPAPCHYLATDAGLAAVDANTGMKPVEELLGKEPQYLPIYQRILEMASAPDGCAKVDFNKAVDTDELCQSPRRYAEYFIFRLEQVAALSWDGTWKATDLGRDALKMIA